MKNFFTRLFKKAPISDLAFKCTLKTLKSGRRLSVVLRNGSVTSGEFVDGNDSEIVVRVDTQFLGIPKTDISEISILDATKQMSTDFSDPAINHPDSATHSAEGSQTRDVSKGKTVETAEVESVIQRLRERQDVDPELDSDLMIEASGGSAEALRNLFSFFSKNRWICYYDGSRLKCPKLDRFVSIPKAIKGVFSVKGYYLCTVYAIKGKIPPILVLIKCEIISSHMDDDLFVSAGEVPRGIVQLSENQPAQRSKLYAVKKNAALRARLVDSMRNLFLPGFVYPLGLVGSRLRSFGFDSSAYGFSKLSTMFEWLKGETVEIGKDSYDHPTVKFKFGLANANSLTIAPQFAFEDFLLVIKNVGGFEQTYTLGELEDVLADNGFSIAECGFDSLETFLRSFPPDEISFEDVNGELSIRIHGFSMKADTPVHASNNPTIPIVSQSHTIANQSPSNIERKGVVTAFYEKRHIGFLVESQTSQTWYFHESKIADKKLMDYLVSGKVGVDVLFSGNDKIIQGKYPAVESVKAFSTADMSMQESGDELSISENEQKNASIWPSGFSYIADYRMKNCPYEGVDARSLKVREFSVSDLKKVQRRLAELRQTRGYIPLELSKFQLTIVTLKYMLGSTRDSVADALSYYFRLCGEAAILNPDYSPQVANFYAVEALKVAAPENHFLLSCLYLLANTYDTEIQFVKKNKTPEDLQGLLKQMLQRGTLERLVDNIPYLEETIPAVVQPLVDTIRILATITPNTTIRQVPGNADLVARCESMTTISAVYFSQLRDLLIQKLGQYSSYEKDMLSAFTDNLSMLVDYAQRRHFLEKESLYLRQKQFLTAFKEKCLSTPTALLVETLLPIAEHFEQLMHADFSKLESQTPNLQVANVLESDGYRLTPDGKIDLRLSITNTDESTPPIESLSLFLKDRESEQSYYSGALGGSMSTKEMELTFKPSETEIIDAAFAVDVMVSFRTKRGESQAGPFPIAVRLETQEQEPIENPYLKYAGGYPIEENDDRMFFGRDDMVMEICETLAGDQGGQCFVLYGQRRSGKTSIMRQIKNHLPDQCFYTSITAQSFDYSREKILTEFAKLILDATLDECDRQQLDSSGFPSFEYADKDSVLALKQISRSLKKQGKNWIVSVDEFTSIFAQGNQVGVASFMRSWKALLEGHVFNALVIGQDTMPKFKQAYPNEFSVTHDRRLSFLSETDSATLASEPINTKEGESRFRGNSLTKVYQKTAGSPYFLQRFCSELVKYLNRKGAGIVTEADIEVVSDNLVHGRGDQPLVEENFDALVSSGEVNLSTIPEDELWGTLTAIAKHSNRASGWCAIDELELDPMYKHKAAMDLCDRGTLDIDGEKIRIRVELFAEWLRINERC